MSVLCGDSSGRAALIVRNPETPKARAANERSVEETDESVRGGCSLVRHWRVQWDARQRPSASNAPAPPEVEVAVVQQKDIPIEREWIGTLDGMVNAAVKAQVAGNLLTQNYPEGSFVRKGQLLFQIDPRPFQAAVDQAEGQLAQAKAQLVASASRD